MINCYQVIDKLERLVNVAKAFGADQISIDVDTAEYTLWFLKYHIPYVLPPEEVETVEQHGLVWIELRKTGELYPALRHGNVFGPSENCFYLDEVMDSPDYLVYYRFWSGRPTDEGRASVPWKEEPDD